MKLEPLGSLDDDEATKETREAQSTVPAPAPAGGEARSATLFLVSLLFHATARVPFPRPEPERRLQGNSQHFRETRQRCDSVLHAVVALVAASGFAVLPLLTAQPSSSMRSIAMSKARFCLEYL